MTIHHPPSDGLPCPLAAFTSPGSEEEIHGIHLVYVVDQAGAAEGDLLTFSLWIMNSTAETLGDVTLTLLSLTNEDGAQLSYIVQPTAASLSGLSLGPFSALNYTLAYQVSRADAQHGGLLISAIQTTLLSPSHGKLISECDALVAVRAPVVSSQKRLASGQADNPWVYEARSDFKSQCP